MSLNNEGVQNLNQSENIHKSGYYNKDISHSNYDTFRNVHKIELNNSLDDLVVMAINEVKDWFKQKIEDKDIIKSNEEPKNDIIEYIRYNGDLDQIIDGCVPIYNYELKGLFFINEDALIEAFENMGLGDRSDYENSPLGFEGISIYCYIESEVNYWLSDSFEDWFSSEFWTVF